MRFPSKSPPLFEKINPDGAGTRRHGPSGGAGRSANQTIVAGIGNDAVWGPRRDGGGLELLAGPEGEGTGEFKGEGRV